MWPIDDLTSKSEPRYLFIVLAFAGDSTMTRDLYEPVFAILSVNRRFLQWNLEMDKYKWIAGMSRKNNYSASRVRVHGCVKTVP
jgi:hypothetical protein